MTTATMKLDKDYGVIVTTGGKRVLKQFELYEEMESFVEALRKFDGVLFEVIDRIKSNRGIYGRSNSIAFVEVRAHNVPGGVWYTCVPVRPLKGHLFCTDCHDYKKFTKSEDEYGTTYNSCPDCDLPDTEYYNKIANDTWSKK